MFPKASIPKVVCVRVLAECLKVGNQTTSDVNLVPSAGVQSQQIQQERLTSGHHDVDGSERVPEGEFRGETPKGNNILYGGISIRSKQNSEALQVFVWTLKRIMNDSMLL